MSLRHHLCTGILMLGFLLGIHNGYIALWRSGEASPARVFPYKAALLPEEDRQRLEAGIHIRDEEHLQNLLADYLS